VPGHHGLREIRLTAITGFNAIYRPVLGACITGCRRQSLQRQKFYHHGMQLSLNNQKHVCKSTLSTIRSTKPAILQVQLHIPACTAHFTTRVQLSVLELPCTCSLSHFCDSTRPHSSQEKQSLSKLCPAPQSKLASGPKGLAHACAACCSSSEAASAVLIHSL
jgi:hypothetical protein